MAWTKGNGVNVKARTAGAVESFKESRQTSLLKPIAPAIQIPTFDFFLRILPMRKGLLFPYRIPS
jgi:hypothetical protein